MGVLKARVNGAWVEVTGATEQVVVGGTIPAPGDDKIWFDPGGVMVPPNPGDPIKALWAYDGSPGATQGWHKVEVGGASEIEVSAVDPITVNPEYELWVDSSVQAPPPVQTDEVWVGPTDPRLAVPPGVQELWQDTSVTPPLLRYWDGTAWVASLYPYLPLAGGALTGPVTSSSTVTVAGAITANGGITMGSGDVIQFPNEASPTTKIVMYGTPTSGFGMGVEGGNLTSFGSGFKFRQSSMTGTEWANFDANGLGPRTTINVTFQTSWTGTMDFRVNPAMVTLRMSGVTYNDGVGGSERKKVCVLPAGVPAPWGTLRYPTTLRSGFTAFPNVSNSENVWVEVASDGVWVQYGYDGPGGGYAVDATMTWAR